VGLFLSRRRTQPKRGKKRVGICFTLGVVRFKRKKGHAGKRRTGGKIGSRLSAVCQRTRNGDGIRTRDLRLMRPTSLPLLYPAIKKAHKTLCEFCGLEESRVWPAISCLNNTTANV